VLLAELTRLGGSDLHLRAGSPPWARVDGLLDVLPDQPVLTAEDTGDILREVVRRDLVDRFAAGIEVDFGYDSPAGGRYRVNAYR